MDESPIFKEEEADENEYFDNDEPGEKSPVTFFLAMGSEANENEDQNDMMLEGENKDLKSTIDVGTSSRRKEKLKPKTIEDEISPTEIFENEIDDDDDDISDDECDVDPLQEEGEMNSADDKLKGATKKEDGVRKTVQFTCEFCPGLIFPCSKAFTLHRRKKHPDTQRIVEVEINKFLYDDTWGIFLNSNGPDKIFTCGTCFATQKSLSKLCRHIDYLHKNVPRPRSHEYFSSQFNIQVGPDGSTLCPECGKTYSSRQIMLSHLRLHNREKTIVCPAPNCGQRFHYKSNLKFHMRIHSGEKQNKCSVCQKTFSIKGDLREHFQTHLIQDPRPYKCGIDGSAFAWKKGLIEHIKKYHPVSGEVEKFECPFENCDKTFVSKSNYKKHLLCHEPRPNLLCDLCDTNGKKMCFKTSSGLQRHVDKVHNSDNPATSKKNKKRIRKEKDNNEKSKKTKKTTQEEEDETVIIKEDVEMIKIEVDPII